MNFVKLLHQYISAETLSRGNKSGETPSSVPCGTVLFWSHRAIVTIEKKKTRKKKGKQCSSTTDVEGTMSKGNTIQYGKGVGALLYGSIWSRWARRPWQENELGNQRSSSN